MINEKQPKIVAIEDEEVIQKMLKSSLEAHEFQISFAKTGKEGLELCARFKPQLILLDLGLPDISGFEVLQRLRGWTKTPVIILTVKETDEDKVRLLDAGADDYLTKPFSIPELLARIRVALRHADKEIEASPTFESGPLKINFNNRQVYILEKEIKLTATEYALLQVLAKNAGKVVTQRQLLKEVWGPNSVEHSHYLRVYVGHLRDKIEKPLKDVKLIMTESGVGYRLLLTQSVCY